MEDSTAEGTGVEGANTTIDELEKVIQPAPEPESEPGESEDVAQTGTDPASEEDEQEEVPEEIEFDFGGNKLSVRKDQIPEELADKVQQFGKGLWSEYTKKSQALAEQTKGLEAREKAVQKLSTMQGEALDSYSQGLRLKSEIQELQKMDLNEMWQSDPDRARQFSDTISQKQAEFNNIVNRVSQQEQALQEAKETDHSRRFDEGKKVIEGRINGFESKVPDLINYVVKEYGVDRKLAEATWALDPVSAEMAYKSMLFDKMQSQARTKAKSTPKEAAVIKAVKGAGGRATPNTSKMNATDYRIFRMKQKRATAG